MQRERLCEPGRNISGNKINASIKVEGRVTVKIFPETCRVKLIK